MNLTMISGDKPCFERYSKYLESEWGEKNKEEFTSALEILLILLN